MPAEALDYTESKKRTCSELFLTKPKLDSSGTYQNRHRNVISLKKQNNYSVRCLY